MSRELTAGFLLPLAPADAWPLFTATGERTWVHGWDPGPAPGDSDEQPGTVFVTAAHGATTTWVVTAAEPGRLLSYARVTPGRTAGTVTVTCEPEGAAGTRITVTYRMTALDPSVDAELAAFAADYPEYLAGWRDAIVAALGR